MWHVAAEASSAGGPSEALIYAIGAFLGIVVTTVGTIIVQALKARTERTAPAPLAPVDAATAVQLAKDIGALVERADDNDERDEMQDRRLTALERWAEHHDPGWWL